MLFFIPVTSSPGYKYPLPVYKPIQSHLRSCVGQGLISGILRNYDITFFVSRQKRKVQQQRQKLQEKMRLKMILPGDAKDVENTDMEVFSLANIKSKQVLTLANKNSDIV